MKKIICLTILALSVFIFSNFAAAGTMSYTDAYSHNYWVQSDSGTPSYWVKLGFPDSTSGTYSGGSFEYDDYLSSVQSLLLTLKGNDDNSNAAIDIYLSFKAYHGTYFKIGSYDVPEYQAFTLTADIKNNSLLLNGTSVGTLTNVSLNNFLNTDYVWVGYGCHFTHLESGVSVSVSSSPPPVAEPSTMILLGFGLVGLGGFKMTFKKS